MDRDSEKARRLARLFTAGHAGVGREGDEDMRTLTVALGGIVTGICPLSGFAENPTSSPPPAASAVTQATDRVDITTQSGQVYKNCKVNRVEPDGITVVHSKGIGKIPFADLPVEMQQKYQYDPQKATAYQADVAKARAAQFKAQQANQARQQELAAVMSQVQEEEFDGKVSDISGDSALGWRVSLRYHAGDSRYAGSSAGVGRPYLSTAKEPVMIFGLPRGLVDGASWKGKIYTAGTAQFETVEGGVKTVKRYATTKELAARLLSQDR